MVQPLSKTPGYVDPSKMHERFFATETEPQNQPETPAEPVQVERAIESTQASAQPVQATEEVQEVQETKDVPAAAAIRAETEVPTPQASAPVVYDAPSLDSVLLGLTSTEEKDDPFDALIVPLPTERPDTTEGARNKKAPESVLARLTSVGNSGASNDIREGIVQSANALGIDPLDLATAISYETAGTFNPTKRGPRTKWGQHRGLIQFGEPQARQFGVDWNDPVRSQLGANGAVVKYLKAVGVKPGMGLLEIYSAINAGGIGEKYYRRSDAKAGGAPGTVRQKVERQMSGHRTKAQRILGV